MNPARVSNYPIMPLTPYIHCPDGYLYTSFGDDVDSAMVRITDLAEYPLEYVVAMGWLTPPIHVISPYLCNT
jgi:hypothetical protein